MAVGKSYVEDVKTIIDPVTGEVLKLERTRKQIPPKLVNNSSGYCEEHEKIAAKHYDKFTRSPKHNQRYCYQWRLNGRYTFATEVHHIKPVADGGKNDVDNLMALCRRCHARIHGNLERIKSEV